MAGVGSYGVASAAFLSLFALLCVGWISRHWAISALIVTTLLWSISGYLQAWQSDQHASLHTSLEFARSFVLLCLIGEAIHRLSGGDKPESGPFRLGKLVPFIAVIALLIGAARWFEIENSVFLCLLGHVGIAVAGLFLIENLFQISRQNSLWAAKHMLIGIGTIFAFDLFFYTEALLFLRTDETIQAAQPIIAILAMPLILISARRLRDVSISLPVSRELMVSTTALLASGVYILCVAGIAYLIRGLGWTWGPTLQLIFFVGAAMVLLVVFSSTSLRHGGRRLIERNLFTFAYDYRQEWRRLVNSMVGDADGLSLDKRALKAATTLMDADGGVLFLRDRKAALRYKSAWNIAIDNETPEQPPEALCQALSAKRPAIVFGQLEMQPAGLEDDHQLKSWLQNFRDPWIALGLLAHQDLIGVMMITRPRMQRRLTWEDLDLLEIFAHQLGSYLTVEELARQVAEAEHFDRMSKHVAFVGHDLKNLISQLSLVLQQAKHHAHNPAFVSDSFLTIGDAVEKMTCLMRRVQDGTLETPLSDVDLGALLRSVSIEQRCAGIDISSDRPILVEADPATLESVIDHLIDNADEASQANGKVMLSLREEDGKAIVDISDDGPGMTRDFIETELFKPFASTKSTGFGIGMYQCRDWIERWQGQLSVQSQLNRGTKVTIALPLADRNSRRTEIERSRLGKLTKPGLNARDMPSIGEHAA